MQQPINLSDKNRKVPSGGMRTSDIPVPNGLYGVSKLFGEDLGKLFATQSNIEFIALRLGWYLKDDVSELKGTIHGEYMQHCYLSTRDLIGKQIS
jgi:dTDP-4-dehydrorhamnose reductase